MLPITSLQLDHKASAARVPTGIVRPDEMLGGKGVFRGSSVLVSGSAGTGKSSVGAKFIDDACRRGERALLFTYEELSAQIVRNMRSIGIDLEPWVKAGMLQIHASRPTLQGLEQHLVMMHDAVQAFQPSVVAVDPISNLTLERDDSQVKAGGKITSANSCSSLVRKRQLRHRFWHCKSRRNQKQPLSI